MLMHAKGMYDVYIVIIIFIDHFEASELANIAVKLSEKLMDNKSQLKLLNVLQIEKKVWDDIKVKTDGSVAFLMLLMHWVGNRKGSKTELEVQLKKLDIIFI